MNHKFEDKDRPVYKLPMDSTINYHLAKWTKKAKIEKHITFHCSRHTFATMMLTLGVDIYTTSKLLGHANVETTQIYGKIIDKKKQEAVSLVDNLFGDNNKDNKTDSVDAASAENGNLTGTTNTDNNEDRA